MHASYLRDLETAPFFPTPGLLTNFLAGVLLVFVASSAAFASEHSLFDLGIPEGYAASKAYDINDKGQVVGSLSDGTNMRGFIWDAASGMQILSGGETGSGWATAINNNGWIAGRWNNIAALWQGSSSAPVPLGTLGGLTSTAFKINDNNQISGYSDLAYNAKLKCNPFHGFIYEFGRMTDIATLTDSWGADSPYGVNYDNGYSFAYGINNLGEIAGVGTTDSFANDAFIRNADGSKIDLGLGPDPLSLQASAVAINDAGLVGGHYCDSSRNSHPVIWEAGSVDAAALTMPEQFPYGQVYGINEKGSVVGIMWNDKSGPYHAFLYDPTHGVRDLNDLIPAESGWVLNYAKGINESGQISGYGLFNGRTTGFVLNSTPEPISSALFLLGGAAIGWRKFRRRKAAA